MNAASCLPIEESIDAAESARNPRAPMTPCCTMRRSRRRCSIAGRSAPDAGVTKPTTGREHVVVDVAIAVELAGRREALGDERGARTAQALAERRVAREQLGAALELGLVAKEKPRRAVGHERAVAV